MAFRYCSRRFFTKVDLLTSNPFRFFPKACLEMLTLNVVSGSGGSWQVTCDLSCKPLAFKLISLFSGLLWKNKRKH